MALFTKNIQCLFSLSLYCSLVSLSVVMSAPVAAEEDPLLCGQIEIAPETTQTIDNRAVDIYANESGSNAPEFGDLPFDKIQLKVISTTNPQDWVDETNRTILAKLDELKLPNTLRLPVEAIAYLENEAESNLYQLTNTKAYVDATSPTEAIDFNQLREKILGIYIEAGFLLNEIEPIIYLQSVAHGREDLQERQFNLILAIRQPSIGRLYYDFPEIDEGKSPSSIYEKEILCDRLIDAIGGLNQAIDYDTLQNNLIYLRNDPNIENVEAYLKPYENGKKGLLELEILISEKKSQELQVTFENTTPESVGDQKYAITYSNNNLSRFGDRLSLGYSSTTTGGINALNLSYQIPLDEREKTFTLNFAPSWTRITNEPFDQFDITSRTQFFSAEYRHPLIRRLDEELAFSFSFDFQNGQSFIFNDIPTAFGNGVNDQGITRTSTFVFRQNYIRRSTKGAWILDSKFSFGSGLFGATTNRWNEPGGLFNKWEGYFQRLQKLSEKNSLLLQGKVQLTPKTLASSQQFFIGGMNTVRGYRANARTADNGLRFSLEDYITLRSNDTGDPTVLLIPFVDLGYVWNNPATSNGLNQPQFLSSVGMGLQLNEPFGVEDLTAEIYWAHPFSDLKDRGNSLQDDGFYFSLGYNFNIF